MISKISVTSFKSLEEVSVELGLVNVFVGANGSGKSNLLEAIGVLSAAADGKVDDQRLKMRGVRPGVPKLYKSAFPAKIRQPSHIWLSAQTNQALYEVSLNNPLDDPSPAWRYKTETWKRTDSSEVLVSRAPRNNALFNPEQGLAALKSVDIQAENPGSSLLRRLQGYLIFAPTTPVLRGIALEPEPVNPVGLSGGRLPEAVAELLRSRKEDNPYITRVCSDVLSMIDWAKNYGSAPSASMPLSPSASATSRVVRFTDRYMKEGRNILSGYDASEGALYVLLLAVLAAHPRSPRFFAIDNADHGLNPGLLTRLMANFSQWILDAPEPRQVLMTSHNPAALDGLPLQDDRVRLFTVDRDNRGATVVRRIMVDEKLLAYAQKGWTLSRLWMNKLIGGMPNV